MDSPFDEASSSPLAGVARTAAVTYNLRSEVFFTVSGSARGGRRGQREVRQRRLALHRLQLRPPPAEYSRS